LQLFRDFGHRFIDRLINKLEWAEEATMIYDEPNLPARWAYILHRSAIGIERVLRLNNAREDEQTEQEHT
jgi:hypothetical protein